tara:strand:- start:373 stop:603 length:231 start_codon:yes stop_codon:yes gene_type:complete
MASLQDLKNKILNPSYEPPKKAKSLSSLKKDSLFLEVEEARYLLSLIANTDFSGKDIQIVYNTALKLQEIIKENMD